MSGYKKNDFVNYKRGAIRTAKDFSYGDEVIHDVKKAKTSDEISRIMNKARKNKEW